MKALNYIVYRFYGVYRNTTPVFLIYFGITAIMSSIGAILINTTEMWLGYKLLTVDAHSWLIVPVVWLIMWLWIYLHYIRHGRYKTFRFTESRKARVLKGIGLVMLIIGSFVCAELVYAKRFAFFGDIPK